MTVITHARRKSRLATMIDAAGGISVLRALADAQSNLEALRPPSMKEVAVQAARLGEITPEAHREEDALNRLYLAATSIIDAAGPFDLDDVCSAARALCDLIDLAGPDAPFDWRLPQVFSSSLTLMLGLPRQDPGRAAIKAHLDKLAASKGA